MLAADHGPATTHRYRRGFRWRRGSAIARLRLGPTAGDCAVGATLVVARLGQPRPPAAGRPQGSPLHSSGWRETGSTPHRVLAANGPISGFAWVSADSPSSIFTPRAMAAISLPAWKQVKSGRFFHAQGPQSLTPALMAASCTMLISRS